MISIDAARLAGALGRLAAAGLSVTCVEVQTPEGPVTITTIAAEPPRPDGALARWVAAQRARARPPEGEMGGRHAGS